MTIEIVFLQHTMKKYVINIDIMYLMTLTNILLKINFI